MRIHIREQEECFLKPTLIVMAAGMGSRYGGLKQIDPVGPHGELIIEYAVYDAIKAGFGKVVFVIKEEMATLFTDVVGRRLEAQIPVAYAHQRLDDLPAGFSPPMNREKPWGTGHAVYCCRHLVNEPFAVINADDYYGADAFHQAASFLQTARDDERLHFCMVGYYVENTLTEHGHVARGACAVSDDGYLEGITERTRMERVNGAIRYFEEDGKDTVIPQGTIVSLNMWGFSEALMRTFEPRLIRFLSDPSHDLSRAEFFLPFVVDALIQEKRADVAVLKTHEKWYGVTYREDKQKMEDAIRAMIQEGKYPEKLW